MARARGPEGRWSRLLMPLLCCTAVACSRSSPAPGDSGGGGGGAQAGSRGGAGGGGAPGSGGASGTSGTGGGGGASGGSGGSGGGAGGGGIAGADSTSGTGGVAGSGGGSGTGGASGNGGASGGGGASGTGGAAGGVVIVQPGVFVNYEYSGSWPTQKIAFKTRPGALTYKKVTIHEQFLAESCAIADYNHDGIPDVSSGRRWYQGPAFTKEHIFRGGHDALPRTGNEAFLQGVSDDSADYPFDMDGDGWADIINIAPPEEETKVSLAPAPQAHATAFWYRNPGPDLAGDPIWSGNLLHADIRGEQHGLVDVNGDGWPEIFGACRDCPPPAFNKGYYFGDPTHPTAAWKYRAITPTGLYLFPAGGLGLLHGFGFSDVDGDGKPDFLERGGAWLQGPDGSFPGGAPSSSLASCTGNPASCGWVKMDFFSGAPGGNQGGAHMYAWDIDGDGDVDVFSADWAHGEGLAWYENTSPDPRKPTTFSKHTFMNKAADKALFGVYFTEPHAAQVADMDGDGVPDIITGKMRLANPFSEGDPDPHGVPYVYVFKTVRDMPGVSGQAHLEPHLVDGGPVGPYVEGATGMAGAVGVGRQIAIGHVNTDGILDICVATKLGLYVFLGQ
jgi:hypothetical protein